LKIIDGSLTDTQVTGLGVLEASHDGGGQPFDFPKVPLRQQLRYKKTTVNRLRRAVVFFCTFAVT
jgi:hypothetical protein